MSLEYKMYLCLSVQDKNQLLVERRDMEACTHEFSNFLKFNGKYTVLSNTPDTLKYSEPKFCIYYSKNAIFKIKLNTLHI